MWTKLAENAKFCHVCGASLGKVVKEEFSVYEQKWKSL